MCTAPAAKRRCQRRAFTLLELVLVLAILVAISALAAPVLRSPLESYRLRRSADLVRAEWTKAKNAAIKTGTIQVFYYELGGSRYVVQPWFVEGDTGQLSAPSFGQAAPRAEASGENLLGGLELPEGIFFASGETADAAQETAADESTSPAASASGAAGSPIVFYPDGTTSTARVVLANQLGQQMTIDLRGLTGIAQVSDVLSE